MHCSKHPSEPVVGICAACLRVRLLNLVERQEDQNELLYEKSFQFSDSESINPAHAVISEEAAVAASVPADPKLYDQERKSDYVNHIHDDRSVVPDGSIRRSKSVADTGNGTDLLRAPRDGPRKASRRKFSWWSLFGSLDDGSTARTRINNRNTDVQVCGIASSSVNRFSELQNPGSTPSRATPSHGNVSKRKLAQEVSTASWLASLLHLGHRKTNRFAASSASYSLKSQDARPSQDEFSSIKDLARTHEDVHRSAPRMFPIQPDPAQALEEPAGYFSDTSDISKRGRSRFHNPFREGSQDLTVQYGFRDKKNTKVHANCQANAKKTVQDNDQPRRSATDPRGLGPRTLSAPSESKLRIQQRPAGSASPRADHCTTSGNRSPKRFALRKKDFAGLSFCLSPLRPVSRKPIFNQGDEGIPRAAIPYHHEEIPRPPTCYISSPLIDTKSRKR